MSTLPTFTPPPAVQPVARRMPAANSSGVAARLGRLAKSPWATGVASFFTTVMMLLPVEYEAPLRSALFLISVKRF